MCASVQVYYSMHYVNVDGLKAVPKYSIYSYFTRISQGITSTGLTKAQAKHSLFLGIWSVHVQTCTRIQHCQCVYMLDHPPQRGSFPDHSPLASLDWHSRVMAPSTSVKLVLQVQVAVSPKPNPLIVTWPFEMLSSIGQTLTVVKETILFSLYLDHPQIMSNVTLSEF